MRLRFSLFSPSLSISLSLLVRLLCVLIIDSYSPPSAFLAIPFNLLCVFLFFLQNTTVQARNTVPDTAALRISSTSA
ncbi:hypothetical protein H9Q69_002367 [Fusarium xylarioides]|uniref:Uncharacterized protein n=1 Tax=Fusarium xylarioides TaxID=221167 RepID=A0A9P7L611_9HYPO|nr:hypothetical protein H9Q70_002874 [Fusarium xylarioides]KAG5765657.1 hypothetical protein H9Q72_006261 [Fusarium xylarioides]KAG5776684.1 hypothetical protein H9Q73_009650 [Fusarium xylarioides]KAG5798567.1 hypothetical protein H9Q69_002367 [Fusarium xylarioides]KAG5819898.1 hypothetical protein H9Q71_000794 [Fusarium xylarioides]